MSTDLEVQMGVDINNLMSTRDKLQKELTEAKALIAWLKRKNEMLYLELNTNTDGHDI